jgi:hypothetical protein
MIFSISRESKNVTTSSATSTTKSKDGITIPRRQIIAP